MKWCSWLSYWLLALTLLMWLCFAFSPTICTIWYISSADINLIYFCFGYWFYIFLQPLLIWYRGLPEMSCNSVSEDPVISCQHSKMKKAFLLKFVKFSCNSVVFYVEICLVGRNWLKPKFHAQYILRQAHHNEYSLLTKGHNKYLWKS